MNCTCCSPSCTCAQWCSYLYTISVQQQQMTCTCNPTPNYHNYPSYPVPDYINYHTSHPKFPLNCTPTIPQKRAPGRNKRSNSKLSNISENSEKDQSSTDEHMAEELAKFFKQTSEHRVKMKEDRKNLSRVQLEKVNFDMNDHIDRAGKLSKLYGSHYVEIASLEAKLSLQYETYCDENQPILWPVLPLKL